MAVEANEVESEEGKGALDMLGATFTDRQARRQPPRVTQESLKRVTQGLRFRGVRAAWPRKGLFSWAVSA